MSLLELRDLNVWYDLPGGQRSHAVQGVSLALDPLERTGLIGESGCGKTTTLLAIMGLLPSNATVGGEVLLDGQDILRADDETQRSRRWTDVAIVFQGTMNALNPVQRVGAQVIEPMKLHGIASGGAARSRVRELLEMVGLPGATADRYPHELSGGMRQRAAIAMALSCRPKLLLADEPTTALDVITQARILELLVGLAEDIGLALVLVTHDLPVVAQVCGRAAVMYAGEIIESGSVASVYETPCHPYTRRLLDATPALYAHRRIASIPGAPPRLDRPITGCAFRQRCEQSMPRCADERPRLEPVAAAHAAACHLDCTSIPATHGAVDAREPPADPPAPDNSGAKRAAPRSDEGPLAEVRDLVVRYPVRRGLVSAALRRSRETVNVVDGVSFSLREGEMLALVGESGAGKTTLAHAVLRLVDTHAGSISFAGQEITTLDAQKLRALRRRMQVIYQDPYESLDPRFCVGDIVEEPLLIHRLAGSPQARRQQALDALARTQLSPPDQYIDRYPHELSGGQRQRVAIAASLVVEPDLLIADEPVSMLDVSARAGVLSLLDDLRSDGDMAILMITHDLSTAAQFADRIAVMHRGRIVEEGPADTIVHAPRHDYTRELLAAVPTLHPAGTPVAGA